MGLQSDIAPRHHQHNFTTPPSKGLQKRVGAHLAANGWSIGVVADHSLLKPSQPQLRPTPLEAARPSAKPPNRPTTHPHAPPTCQTVRPAAHPPTTQPPIQPHTTLRALREAGHATASSSDSRKLVTHRLEVAFRRCIDHCIVSPPQNYKGCFDRGEANGRCHGRCHWSKALVCPSGAHYIAMFREPPRQTEKSLQSYPPALSLRYLR